MVKPRYSRLPARKSSSSTLVLTMLIMFTFVILILLALGILSIPSSSGGDSPKANDLSSIVHNTIHRYVFLDFDSYFAMMLVIFFFFDKYDVGELL
jgi:hypothetical protein